MYVTNNECTYLLHICYSIHTCLAAHFLLRELLEVIKKADWSLGWECADVRSAHFFWRSAHFFWRWECADDPRISSGMDSELYLRCKIMHRCTHCRTCVHASSHRTSHEANWVTIECEHPRLHVVNHVSTEANERVSIRLSQHAYYSATRVHMYVCSQ